MWSLYQTLRQILLRNYDESEARSIAFLVLEDAFGIARRDVYADKVIHFSEAEKQRWENILSRLAQGEPVQYVIGHAFFMERPFHVTPATLIPRPETEGLVTLSVGLLSSFPSRTLRILDVGTGSGCIAISLKLSLENAEVEAWDISSEALDTARGNAGRLGAEVKFKETDLFAAPETEAPLHLLVSNPPYVRECERRDMERHVLEYEPATALFVPDEDPLLFYRALAELAVRSLTDSGILAVEVNTFLSEETAGLFRSFGLQDIHIHPDIFGRPRFVTARKGHQS